MQREDGAIRSFVRRQACNRSRHPGDERGAKSTMGMKGDDSPSSLESVVRSEIIALSLVLVIETDKLDNMVNTSDDNGYIYQLWRTNSYLSKFVPYFFTLVDIPRVIA